MTDADRLRDLLERTAPAAPELSAPERATLVARRGRSSRRRDRAIVAGAALAVVVVALAVPTLRGDDTRPEPAEPPLVAACPPVPVDPPDTAPPVNLGDDLVVTAVRVCSASEGALVEAQSGPLTGKFAAAFMDDVRTVQAFDPTLVCTAIGLPPWVLQVQGDSGRVYRVYVSDPCGQSLQVGDLRVRISDVRTVFDGNLQRQRSGVSDLACPRRAAFSDADTWNGSFDPTSATAGIVCQTTFDVEDPRGSTVEGRLDPDQLATIRASLDASPRADPGTGFAADIECELLVQQVVVLADAEGDQAAWDVSGCGLSGLTSIRGRWGLDHESQSALHNALIAGGLS